MQMVVIQQGSDIHLISGMKPYLRVDGELLSVDDAPVLEEAQLEALIYPILTKEQREKFMINKELDLGYQFQNKGRFRVNVYYQQGKISAALRLIPTQIKTIEELKEYIHEKRKNKGIEILS